MEISVFHGKKIAIIIQLFLSFTEQMSKTVNLTSKQKKNPYFLLLLKTIAGRVPVKSV